MVHESVCKIEDLDGVKLITFSRPEARNAFNEELRTAVTSALLSAREDSATKVILLTGEGTSFSAGIDLKELSTLRESKQSGNSITNQRTDPTADSKADGINADTGEGVDTQNESADFQADSWALLGILRDYPKPVFMAVNGAGVGLGTTILGFADIAIAGKSARFKCPFTEMGVGAEASSTWLLPQLVGWQNAAWMLLSSEWIDANEAKEMGLVYDVVEDEELLNVTLDLARKIAAKDLASVMAIKQTMNSWRQQPIELAGQLEGKRFMELISAKSPIDKTKQ